MKPSVRTLETFTCIQFIFVKVKYELMKIFKILMELVKMLRDFSKKDSSKINYDNSPIVNYYTFNINDGGLVIIISLVIFLLFVFAIIKW